MTKSSPNMGKFKPGDKVIVARIIYNEEGWSNGWDRHGMDQYLDGKVYTVDHYNRGIRFLEDRGVFGFPLGSLEFASVQPLSIETKYHVGEMVFDTEDDANQYIARVALTNLLKTSDEGSLVALQFAEDIIKNKDEIVSILGKLK